MSIWLTRPRKDSERMAAALDALGIETLISPVMEVTSVAVSFDGLAMPDGLVLTSRRAAASLAHAPQAWRALPVYSVGSATAQAAQRYGFLHTINGKGSALDLLPLMAGKHRAGATLLHLSGDAVKIDLAPLLGARDITLQRMRVYETSCMKALSPELLHALHVQVVQGVVFYSPRSVQFAAGLARDALPALDAFCLSLDIAAAAAKAGCKRVHACPVPTQQAMMELLREHAIAAP